MFIREQRQLETEEVHGPPPAPALALSPDPRPSSGCSLYKVPGPGTKVWAADWVPVWLHGRNRWLYQYGNRANMACHRAVPSPRRPSRVFSVRRAAGFEVSSFRERSTHQHPRRGGGEIGRRGGFRRQAVLGTAGRGCTCRGHPTLPQPLSTPVAEGSLAVRASPKPQHEEFPNSAIHGHLQDLGHTCMSPLHSFMFKKTNG